MISKKYRSREGVDFDLSQFSEEDNKHLNWVLGEYETAKSWLSFQNRTAHGVIEYAKKQVGDDWQSHPLYKIQLDLIGNIGIQNNELKGEISDMFVEKKYES
jgi:hypothetical protein